MADPMLNSKTTIDEAAKLGVPVIEKCGLTDAQEAGCVPAVKTTKGRVKRKYFVNCGGFWRPEYRSNVQAVC